MVVVYVYHSGRWMETLIMSEWDYNIVRMLSDTNTIYARVNPSGNPLFPII